MKVALRYIWFLLLLSSREKTCAQQLNDSVFKSVRSAKSHLEKGRAYRNIALLIRKEDGNLNHTIKYADSALTEYRMALNEGGSDTSEKNKALRGISTCQTMKGTALQMMQKLGPSVSSYLEALHIQKNLNNAYGQIMNLNNLGILYNQSKENNKALDCYKRALELNKNIDQTWLSATHHGMACVFMDLKDYEQAEAHVLKAVEINKQTGNDDWLANNYTVLAELALIRNQKAKRIEYVTALGKIREKSGEPYDKAVAEEMTGACYLDNGDFKNAELHYKKAFDIASEFQIFQFQCDASHELMRIYEKSGNKHLALEMAKANIRAKDSLIAFNNREEIYRQEVDHEYEIIHLSDSIRMQQEKETMALQLKTKNLEIESERRMKQITYLGLAVVCILLGIALYNFRQKQKANAELEQQKNIVEEKQKEIIDSIQYAQRIQRSLLPSEKAIEKLVNRLRRK